MKITQWVMAAALLGMSYAASADSWHGHHGGRGHHHGKPSSYEYWDGNCKVKREYKRNGRYKEKRDCRPSERYSRRHRDDHRYGINLPSIIIEHVIRIGG